MWVQYPWESTLAVVSSMFPIVPFLFAVYSRSISWYILRVLPLSPTHIFLSKTVQSAKMVKPKHIFWIFTPIPKLEWSNLTLSCVFFFGTIFFFNQTKPTNQPSNHPSNQPTHRVPIGCLPTTNPNQDDTFTTKIASYVTKAPWGWSTPRETSLGGLSSRAVKKSNKPLRGLRITGPSHWGVWFGWMCIASGVWDFPHKTSFFEIPGDS